MTRFALPLAGVLVLAGCNYFASAPTPTASVPPAAVEPAPVAPVPTKPRPAPPRRTPAPEPVAPDPVVPPAPRQELVQLKDRYLVVSAKCESAIETFQQLQHDSRSSGHAVHPDISTSYFRMKSSLEMAKRELDRGEDAEARHSLDVAELSATKVLRAGGGH